MKCKQCKKDFDAKDEPVNVNCEVNSDLDIQLQCPHCKAWHFTFVPGTEFHLLKEAMEPLKPKGRKVAALVALLWLAWSASAQAQAPDLRYMLLGSVTNCIIGLNYDAAPGVRYCIEESADMRHWTDYDCSVSYEFDIVWVLVHPTNSVRFFRLKEED